MDPHFFFCGGLSREESASALVATLYEQRADFRRMLFHSIGGEEPVGSCRVRTEDDRVDVRVEYPEGDTVVLIENKVRSSALQENQLVRYYEQELERSADKRIVVILLAPRRGAGAEEVRRLNCHARLRESDSVDRVSWDAVEEYAAQIPDSDRDAVFIRRGVKCIQTIIEQALEEKYPLVGARAAYNGVVARAVVRLREKFPRTEFGIWRGGDFFDVYLIRSDMSVSLALYYAPDEVADGAESRHIARLKTKFSLSNRGKKNPSRKAEWVRMCDQRRHSCGGDEYLLSGKWFQNAAEVVGSQSQVEDAFVEKGKRLVTDLEPHL